MAESLVIKVNGLVDNHTSRRLAPVIKEAPCANKGDIVTYVRKNKVKKVGDGEDDYVIEEVVVEDSRVNRQAYIQRNADQVGVLNILEKVRRSGDITLLNQTGAVIPDGLQDYTKAPSNVGDALKVVQSGAASFEGLKAIFGDTSFEELAKMSEADVNAKFASYLASLEPKKEEESK